MVSCSCRCWRLWDGYRLARATLACGGIKRLVGVLRSVCLLVACSLQRPMERFGYGNIVRIVLCSYVVGAFFHRIEHLR